MASEEFAEELEVAETETESTERKARISYRVKRKLSAIEKYDEYGGNLSRAARDSGVPRSNLQRWIKQRDKLSSMREECQVSVRKRRRLSQDKKYLKVRGHFPELEAALVEWLSDIRKDGITVHG